MRLNPFKRKKPVVSVLRLEGLIAAGGIRQANVMNDDAMSALIERAFKKGKPAAVALAVNSPGGSPVQSSLIGRRIRRLAEKHRVPVYAFVEDLAVSGGYWLAVSADEIYADSSSLIGSIGVISSSFGFQEAISRIGIERRIYTAGEDKSMWDPFLPENPKHVERLRGIQEVLHENFIEDVKERRGGRLKKEDLFTGRVWTGRDAVDNGLIDGIGTLIPKMQEIYGDEVKFRRYARRRQFPFSIGSEVANSAAFALEERVMRAHYGL